MVMSLQLPTRSSQLTSALPVDSPIKVVLADDHSMVRRTLRLLLDREHDLEVIAEADDAFTALRLVKGRGPNVVLLDLRMPDGSSIDLIHRLHREAPDTAIVVLTMEDNHAFAERALAAGATGYVLKHRADEELLPALRLAERGTEYVSPRLAARLDARRRGADGDGLTPREIEVLRLLSLGLTRGEIAAALHRSRRTIESHVKHIHGKLGLTRRCDLVEYAVRHDLVRELPALGRTGTRS
jgi:two-component system response regulator NreC